MPLMADVLLTHPPVFPAYVVLTSDQKGGVMFPKPFPVLYHPELRAVRYAGGTPSVLSTRRQSVPPFVEISRTPPSHSGCVLKFCQNSIVTMPVSDDMLNDGDWTYDAWLLL